MKASFNKKGNIKLGGTVWAFSTLAGHKVINSQKYGDVMGSCGKYSKCAGCDGSCYVFKSYRYPSVIDSHAKNTLALTDILQAEKDLTNQITRARKKPNVIRIHQSGEFSSKQEIVMWANIASQFPEIQFYAYTKAFDLVTPLLEKGLIPSNMVILFSIWHEYGQEEYKEVAQLGNVKAFVYMDGYDYKLPIDGYCEAYRNGKLNHAITCELCKKCYNKTSKIIGCHEH